MEEVSPDYPLESPSVKSNAFLCARALQQFCSTSCKKLFEVPCLLVLPEMMFSRGPAPLEDNEALRSTGRTQRVWSRQRHRWPRSGLHPGLNKKLTKEEDQLKWTWTTVFWLCQKKSDVK